MSDAHLRPLSENDLPRVFALNTAAVPAVNEVPLDGLRSLAAMCSVALVATVDEEVVGFVLALEPGADYASENYRWFSARSSDFLYVDRIVVDPAAQGGGVGRAFYAAVDAEAESRGRDTVFCEVNTLPPNPESLAFHARLGFVEVGRQSTKGGTVEVALLEHRL